MFLWKQVIGFMLAGAAEWGSHKEALVEKAQKVLVFGATGGTGGGAA